MKWFLIQSLGLAALAFGLGALFHRLLWRKTVGGTFNAGRGGAQHLTANAAGGSADRADLDARVAELRSVKAENLTLIGDRNAKAKELSALSFEHGAAKAKLADHEAELAKLRAELAAKSEVSTVGTGALDAARREHEGVVAQLRQEHESALASLRGEHEATVGRVRSEYETLMQSLAGEHEGALASLRGEHDDTVGRVRSEYETLMQSLAGEHESKVKSLATEHEGTIAALSSRGHETLASVKAEHEAELARVRHEADQHRIAAEAARAAVSANAPDIAQIAGTTAAVGASGVIAANVAGLVSSASGAGEDSFEGDGVTPDDFLKIEGIGPKVNEILQAGGVRTYRRLASMSEDSVRSIVNGGGVSFTPSAGTWAAQAALLRDGDHAGFQALVDKLLSGREEGR